MHKMLQLGRKEVRNSQFFLSFRSQKGGAVKKIVRPQMVHSAQHLQKQETTESNQEGNKSTDPVTTAAVAASAAVAATQPFLQAILLLHPNMN